jgi:competence protein ComGC
MASKKAGIIGNIYLSKDEEKIREGYIYDLGLNNNLEIVDDLAEEYNLEMNENELSLEEASDELLDNEKQNIENKEYQIGNDYKNEISNLEGKFEFNNIEYMDLDN